jgi:hypothetical protein
LDAVLTSQKYLKRWLLRDCELQGMKVEQREGERKMTRQQHLDWCKRRALEYVDAGDLQDAFSSMASDLSKHPETVGHTGIELGMLQLMGGMLSTPEQMRQFIEGFN